MNKSFFAVPLSLGAASAFAAIPAGVTDKITEVQTDITTIGGLILVVAIVIAGFHWMRRAAH